VREKVFSYTGKDMAVRGAVLIVGSMLVAWAAHLGGFDKAQVVSLGIFLAVIMATLLFWQFRLAIAFLGIATLLGARVLTLKTFVESSELPIILFLVGMMVTVGALKDLGFFSWIIQSVIGMKNMTGPLFITILMFLSGLMACLVDEVTSIVFVSALIFQVCDTLKVRPVPFIIIAVLATNIGSAGTMLGNPVGILIGHKAGLTFEDFMVWAFPVMLVSLCVALAILLVFYRHEIAQLTERLRGRREMGLGLGPLVRVPYRRGLVLLGALMVLIASHHRVERLLGVETNTMLIVAPLVVAGVLMILRRDRARHYIETEVEWWTLLFFMLLFAVAGTLEHTEVTNRIAKDFSGSFSGARSLMLPVILFTSALGSAFVDNVVFVAAFVPVVKDLHQTPLWWALLFGACFGGNATMVGSTANIVALGMLEKRYRGHIRFLDWLKVGALVSLVTCLVAWAALTLLARLMPDCPP
jgi:Na+/H+ antiporter NhaD/arsenite permease-like protein